MSLSQVLLFSTMTRALDVIEDYLEWRGFSWLRLDGNTSSGERGGLVSEFNDPGDLGHVDRFCKHASIVHRNDQQELLQ